MPHALIAARHRAAASAVAAASLALSLTAPAMSQETYRQPPADIVKILDAPPTPAGWKRRT